MWSVYLLINNKNNYRYIGISQNLANRLRDHNLGKTKSTKPHRPFDKILELEKFDSRQEARLKERYYKSAAGRRKLKIIVSERSSVG